MKEESRVIENFNDKNVFFNSLYIKYYRPVKNFISKHLNNRQPEEEITQEVFIKLYQNIESLHPESIKGWLYKVAHNEAINYYRKNLKPISSLDEQQEESFSEDTAHDSIERKQQRYMIRNILLKLPKNQATAIYLKDICGFSYQDIADRMEISYEAVKSLIFRGRQNFMKYYEEMNENEL